MAVTVFYWDEFPTELRPAGFGGDEDYIIFPDDESDDDTAERIADALYVCSWDWQVTRERLPARCIVTCHA